MRKIVNLSDVVTCLGDDIIEIRGDFCDKYIDNLADVEHVNETTLDWVKSSNPRRQSIVESTIAKVIIVSEDVEYNDSIKSQGKVLLVVRNPRNAIAKVGQSFFVEKPLGLIHETAIISKGAKVAEGVTVGPFSIIGDAEIGEGTVIGACVTIKNGCIIGRNCKISDHVVLGEEGFGFEKDENGNWFRFPQIGNLVIGDFVEIGPFCAVDRGALSDTIIGNYTKIDSHVKIAHNNVLGNNVVITSGVVIAGSNVIEDNVWIGPNSTFVEWGHVGIGSFVGIGSVVTKKLKKNTKVFGNPAKVLNL